jgi:hypothetical protein
MNNRERALAMLRAAYGALRLLAGNIVKGKRRTSCPKGAVYLC